MNSVRSLVLLGLMGLWLSAACSSNSSSAAGDLDDTGQGTNDTGDDLSTLDSGPILSDDTGGTDSGSTDADASGDDVGDGSAPGCDTNSDCEPGQICIDLMAGPGNGICTTRCFDQTQCPDDAECLLVGDDESAFQVCIDPNLCIDPDGDGYGIGPGCLGLDCDETSAMINPGAQEVCDGIDNNCDGLIDNNPVGMGDDCDTGELGVCAEGRMACREGIPSCVRRYEPGEELCDGRDNDCNGQVDDNAVNAPIWYRDADGDRYGDDLDTIQSCAQPEGYIALGGDCNDSDRAINPGAQEVCDGIDNNCSGEIDDDAFGMVQLYLDADGDGYGDPNISMFGCPQEGWVTNNRDCNDADRDVHPEAIEICDGIDNNCNGDVDEGGGAGSELWYRDADSDGYGNINDAVRSCYPLAGRVRDNTDCDDNNSARFPGNPEICDGIDNNCNGEIDEGVLLTFYRDADNDGYGDDSQTAQACTAPAGYVSRGGDCDDGNSVRFPGNPEICDGIDNNCNGEIDEGVLPTWYRDLDGDGYGDDSQTLRSCSQPSGYVARGGDCDDNNSVRFPGNPEICDGIDNNCNGLTDEGIPTSIWYRDADNDGYGDPNTFVESCSRPTGYVANGLDCDDTSALRFPGNPEVCDGIDNDCNGLTDDNASDASVWYRDADDDGYGNSNLSVRSCSQPDGYVAQGGDCDDNSALRFPGNPEVCDGIDNDCNHLVDDGLSVALYYRDADGDGWGDPNVTIVTCAQPLGYITRGGDCNDANASVNPDATELCDGIDNNCNGLTDEGLTSLWYRDADNDGYGNPNLYVEACTQPAGYVGNGLDCDDGNALRFPGNPEVCDGIDNNCNGVIDDNAIDAPTWYYDQDKDGWGGTAVVACTQPSGTVTRGGDCNDNNGAIHPGAQEVCDGIDNNCDGSIDNSAIDATWWYLDSDGDGQGAYTPINIAPMAVRSCNKPADFCIGFFGLCFERIPYVNNDWDCDDSSARACRGCGPEVCDGYDNDCNGTRDDGFTRDLILCKEDDNGYPDLSTKIQVCASPVDASAGTWVSCY